MKGYGLIVAIMFMTSLSVIAVAYGENEQPGTSSHTYYVDKYSISGNCSDENVGNLTEPLCTINAAVDKLQSFSSINIEIYVRKGTYSHQEDALEHGYWITTDAVNTIGNKLLISNYPGEEVVIDCMGSNIGFNLYGSGITVQGLEIINFSSYAIYMGDNFDYNSVSILENRIHGCADNSYSCSGISIVGKNGHVIRGNEIFDLMTNEGSEYSGIKMRSNNAIIEKNTVYDNRNNGIRVIGKNNTIRENKIYNHFSGSNPKGIYASGERNTIHNNTLFENRYNINIASCEECTVSGNMVYSTFNQIGNGILVTNSIRARVLQNTITNIPGYGIKVHEWTHSFELKNNIIYNTGQNAIYIESQSVTGAAFESDYNLFHSFQQRPIYFMGREYGNGTDYTFDHYMDESGQDRNSIFQENPLFINENVFDFYPRVESPVCNMSSEGSHIGALPCKGQDTSADEEPTPSVPPCNPDWDCLDWSDCVNNTKARKCFDWNECDRNESKPIEIEACQNSAYDISPDNQTGDDQNNTNLINRSEDDQPPEDEGLSGDDAYGTGGNRTNHSMEEEPEVIENFTRRHIRIEPDHPAIVDIEKPNIGVREIQIKVKRNVTAVELSVARISKKPPKIEPNATGVAYQFLNITHDNIGKKDIDLITILFDVNKSWVSDNNVNMSDIYLGRFTVDQWTRLPTRLINETGDRVFFKAISPGLSIFSIMAGSVLSGSNRTCVPFDIRCEGEVLQECSTTGEEWITKQVCEHGCSETTGCLKSQADGASDPWFLMYILIVIILVLGLLGFYFNSKREGLTNEIREMQSRS